jgi:hypothetical protein
MKGKIASPLLLRFALRTTLLCLLPVVCAAAVGQSATVSHITTLTNKLGPSPDYPSDTVFVPLLTGVTTVLEGWTEYDTSTCALISTGSYTSPTTPKYGKLSYAVMNGTLSSGPCAGTVLPFNVASYMWTAAASKAPQDFFSLQWTTPDGQFVENSDWLAELLPKMETTMFKAWDPTGLTDGEWQQTIQTPKIVYNGVTVQESNPGGGGPDTCWFSGSIYAPFTAITGGTWTVGAGNKWGFDYVGWFSPAVTYYRSKGRAPCGTTFPQQMQIQFATGDPTFYNYAAVNTLGGSIGTKTVTTIRAGKSKKKVWP